MTRIVSLSCVLLLAACSAGPRVPGVPTTFDAVCDKSNDGKRLSLEGYVDFPSSFKSNEISIMMRLRPELRSSPRVVGVSVELGNGPNRVEMPPKSFTPENIKLHTSDGRVAGFMDKVKVSGTMYTPSSLATVEFKCGLTNVLIESTGR